MSESIKGRCRGVGCGVTATDRRTRFLRRCKWSFLYVVVSNKDIPIVCERVKWIVRCAMLTSRKDTCVCDPYAYMASWVRLTMIIWYQRWYPSTIYVIRYRMDRVRWNWQNGFVSLRNVMCRCAVSDVASDFYSCWTFYRTLPKHIFRSQRYTICFW